MRYLEIGHLPKLEYASNEALNTLATNLSYCGDNIKTIMITSRYAYEGKSFVSMHLMNTLASLGKSVVLLDTDLRRSKMMSQYQMRFADDMHYGLAHYLSGKCEMEAVVYETNVENGYVIPIGREVNSSLQLLSSERMPVLMEALRREFDVVLVDTPPAGVIVDALEMAKYCDGALLVVCYNRGRRKDVDEIAKSISKTGCPVLGSVLNNVDFKSFTSRNHYYKSERYATYYKRGYAAYSPVKHAKKK